MNLCIRLVVFAAALSLLVAACRGHRTSDFAGPAATVDTANAGSLSGTVTLVGPLPDSKPIDMSASPACMQANLTTVVAPTVVTGEKGALANVVVYIKTGLGNYRYDSPSDTAVLAQKNCMYEPHVLALMTGQPFAVENNDPTMHNVHPMPNHNRQWSNSQPAGSAPLKQTFANPEFAMPVLCNVHPWMRAFVFAFEHPYFAVTSETGTFALKNVPPGTYTIEAWHESHPAQDQAVTVGPKQAKAVAFTFQSIPKARN